MIKMNVISVGEKALNAEDKLVILFGTEVSERLKEVSVIQRIEMVDDYQVKKGMHLMIDDQEYEVVYAGSLVKDNLETVHHTVLDFNPLPEEPRENAIYLTPATLPEIKENTKIVIE